MRLRDLIEKTQRLSNMRVDLEFGEVAIYRLTSDAAIQVLRGCTGYPSRVTWHNGTTVISERCDE